MMMMNIDVQFQILTSIMLIVDREREREIEREREVMIGKIVGQWHVQDMRVSLKRPTPRAWFLPYLECLW